MFKAIKVERKIREMNPFIAMQINLSSCMGLVRNQKCIMYACAKFLKGKKKHGSTKDALEILSCISS